MLIYVIRHGQTDWNVEGRLQGGRDIPLNETGRAQARSNGRALAGLIGDTDKFDFVASPLGRTRATMELVRSEMGLDPHAYRTDDRLIEVSFGDWEGRTLAEIEALTPGANARRDADKWHFLPPGANAESYELLSRRVASWLKSVNRPTVCVCHGGVIRSLFRLVADIPAQEAALAPVYQDRLIVMKEGRIAWLGEPVS